MPLVTAARFPGLFAQPSNRGLTEGINQAFGHVSNTMRLNKIMEAKANQATLDNRAGLFQYLRGIEDPDKRYSMFMKLANDAAARKEPGMEDYYGGIGIDNPDEFGLYLSTIATRRGAEPQERFTDVLGPDGEVLAQESSLSGEDIASPLAPVGTGSLGKYQPGNYSPESWAEFVSTKDPSVLEQKQTQLLKVDRGDRFDFLHPISGDLVKSEQKNLKPSDELDYVADRTRTEETVKDEVAAAEEMRVNTRTYKPFLTGMTDYANALQGTMSGYFAGRVPAIAASQQIAEGGKSVMLPLLKQLFRGAGEGTFTDKDQELLEGMLPTRKDQPEAQIFKLNMVNKIVAMKLGMEPPPDIVFGQDEEVDDFEAMTDEQLRAIAE